MKQAYFTVKDLDTNQEIFSSSKIYAYATESISGSFNVQKNKRYLLTLTPNGVAGVECTYSHKDPIDNFGIRLKSVTHSENGQVSEYKKFYYRPASLYANKEEDLVFNEMKIIPNIENATFDEMHDNMNLAVTYAVHSSTNSSPLYNSRLQERYKYVTCSIGGDNFENGGYEKTFSRDSDDLLERIQPASAEGVLVGSPSAGVGFNGTLDGYPNFFGILLNSMYFPARGNRLSFSGLLKNTKYYVKKNGNIYKNKQIQNKHRYTVLKTNPNFFIAKPFKDYTNAYCGSNYLLRIAPFYISIYKNYTVDTKLEKETVTDYIDEIPLTLYNSYDDYNVADSLGTSESAFRKLITTTNYEYSGMPSHNQVTKQIVTTPDSSITETSFLYAGEKGNQKLLSANMIGIPLETMVSQTKNGATKIISKTETLYPINQSEADAKTSGLALPYQVNSTDLLNIVSTEVTYDKYDDKGNLLQYTTRDGVPVTIIWGYNKTMPIAKIIGIDYITISDAYGDVDIINASNVDAGAGVNNDETALLNTLTAFKNTYFRHQVTTYTYDPLVGVRSITPPSGIREVYLYDSANRLKEVREQNQTGKLLKEFKYNYKN
jgi:hypothetical protein